MIRVINTVSKLSMLLLEHMLVAAPFLDGILCSVLRGINALVLCMALGLLMDDGCTVNL
jgi:hypothetical protein